jgi:hypothetical protein
VSSIPACAAAPAPGRPPTPAPAARLPTRRDARTARGSRGAARPGPRALAASQLRRRLSPAGRSRPSQSGRRAASAASSSSAVAGSALSIPRGRRAAGSTARPPLPGRGRASSRLQEREADGRSARRRDVRGGHAPSRLHEAFAARGPARPGCATSRAATTGGRRDRRRPRPRRAAGAPGPAARRPTPARAGHAGATRMQRARRRLLPRTSRSASPREPGQARRHLRATARGSGRRAAGAGTRNGGASRARNPAVPVTAWNPCSRKATTLVQVRGVTASGHHLAHVGAGEAPDARVAGLELRGAVVMGRDCNRNRPSSPEAHSTSCGAPSRSSARRPGPPRARGRPVQARALGPSATGAAASAHVAVGAHRSRDHGLAAAGCGLHQPGRRIAGWRVKATPARAGSHEPLDEHGHRAGPAAPIARAYPAAAAADSRQARAAPTTSSRRARRGPCGTVPRSWPRRCPRASRRSGRRPSLRASHRPRAARRPARTRASRPRRVRTNPSGTGRPRRRRRRG